MTEHQQEAEWSVAEWRGEMLVDRAGERVGERQDLQVDVETDQPQFATVKEGFFDGHVAFVPVGRLVCRLYRHYEFNYTLPYSESGRRLARRWRLSP